MVNPLINSLKRIRGVRALNDRLTKMPGLKHIYRPVREILLPPQAKHRWLIHDWVADSLSFARREKLMEFSLTPEGAYVKACDGIQYWYDLDHPVGGLHGIVQGDPVVGSELDLILRNLNPGAVFFDIGAGIGEYALNVATKVPGSYVPCFEPTPETWQCVSRNIKRNGLSDRITLHQLALSDSEGEMAIAPVSQGCFILRSDNMDLSQYTTHTRVKVTTIDKFIRNQNLTQVDFIKADVEGAELFLLKGAEGCLREHKPHLQLELVEYCAQRLGYTVGDIFKYLAGLGYSCVTMVNDQGEIVRLDAGESVPSMLDRALNFFFCHQSKTFSI